MLKFRQIKRTARGTEPKWPEKRYRTGNDPGEKTGEKSKNKIIELVKKGRGESDYRDTDATT